MYQVTEQFAALGKSQLEAGIRFAEMMSESLGKLADVQREAGKAALADSMSRARSIASAKTPAEFLSQASVSADAATAQANARKVYDILAAGQAQFASALEQQAAEYNRGVAQILDAAAKNAPAGFEGALAAVKSGTQSATALFETAVSAVKQTTAAAQATANTVADATRVK